MKPPALPKRLCAWCETPGPADATCAHCGVAFPTIRHEDLPKPPPVDRYSPEEREAFAVLDHVTATMGAA